MPPSLTFECQTITPMLMHGADGKAELRPASIKGILRFWWRAIHGNLSLKDLHEQEGEIFGSTDKRSSFSIRIKKFHSLKKKQVNPVPHKLKDGKPLFTLEAFENNQTFEVIISGQNLDLIQNLFILATTLGGFGQRSRRGFGSVQIVGSEASASPKADENKPSFPKTFKDIEELINQTPKFQNLNKNRDDEYPYIKKIEIGQNPNKMDELLKKISQATHDKKNGDMFGSANPRYASPIYISILKFEKNDYRPIITTLHNTKLMDDTKLNEFKKAIL